MLYIYFADGFEEVEAIATLDVIRRAGIDVLSVGVGSRNITGTHGIKIVCDISSDEATYSGLDGVVLPGGMPGTNNLLNNNYVVDAVKYANESGLLVAAICAAPMILGRLGILKGKKAVCFPGFEDELAGASISDDFVVTDGNVITAKGMGSAVNFGISIVSFFKGKAFADKLKSTLQCS